MSLPAAITEVFDILSAHELGEAIRYASTRLEAIKSDNPLPFAERIRIADHAAMFCHTNRITLHDLCGPAKHQPLAKLRQQFMWECHTRYGKSFAAIGRFLNRDHTSVIWGVRRYKERAGL